MFVLWRGMVIPVQNADANSYHLPKAVLMMKAAGYYYPDVRDVRLAAYPCNYELMLADLLVLDGSDRFSVIPSVLTYVLCLILSRALLGRWCGEGPHASAGALFVAGTPVTLLASGHEKNDLLIGACFLGIFLWSARWCAEGGRAPLILTCVAAALAMGTKVHAVLILAAVAPAVLALMCKRRINPLPWLGLFVLSCAWLGSAVYVNNVLHCGRPLGVSAGRFYGLWPNLYLYPLLLLLVPFGPPREVWVPWREENWLWPHYQVFNSHCGPWFTVLALALPWGCWTGWRASSERLWASAMMVLAFALTLPVRLEPLGMFSNFVRLTLWVIPLVVGWTLVPALARSSDGVRRAGLLGVCLLYFWQAWHVATLDDYAPWKFVRFCLQHPHARITAAPVRAATQLDALAGPEETVAVDQGELDTWMYPAWGRHFKRSVVFLAPGPGPVVIPPEVSWVAIDRPWNKIWGHPGLVDCGKYRAYLYQGQPTEDDLRVYRALLHNPEWELIKEGPEVVNWLFRRRK